MSIVGASVLAAIGDGLRRLAGPLLTPMVEALVAPLENAASLVRPPTNGRPGPALVDLAVSPYPRQLGQLVGVTVPPGLSTEEARAAVTGRGISRRGTRAAMEAAVRATLTGTRTFVLLERDASPYRIRLVTFDAETPNPARTQGAAQLEKPMGLLLTHVVSPGVTWDQFDDEVDLTWNNAETHTWEQLGSIIPGTYP